MSTRPSSAAGRQHETTSAILDAARQVVAERGLSQLSLRVVAERAGVSVGTISYRIGDRATLVDALARRERAFVAAEADVWRSRLDPIDPRDADCLADLVDAWLGACATADRTPALMQSELVSAAHRDTALAEHVAAATQAQAGMWRALLGEGPDAERLGRRIAAYCVDERPFSILLDGDADYRLLRASTIRALLRGREQAPPPAADAWHARLVARLEEPSRAAFEAGEVPRGAKAAIAERIADRIMSGGIEALSHRAIAQALAMPVSSIAHHFPAQRDILLGGVETLYRRLRAEVSRADGASPAGFAVVALGHEMALAALRDPGFRPFAIDMRRRRAENVHLLMSQLLTGAPHADRALTQAYVMAMVGFALGGLAERKGGWDAEKVLARI